MFVSIKSELDEMFSFPIVQENEQHGLQYVTQVTVTLSPSVTFSGDGGTNVTEFGSSVRRKRKQ